MGILIVDLDKINLDDVDFQEDDPKTIIHVRRLAWRNKFEKSKAYKRNLSKELMPVAWHPTRWWDWCIKKMRKKKQNQFLLIKLGSDKNAFDLRRNA